MKNSFFNFLIATNKLDEFLGYKDKETSNLKDDNDNYLDLEDWQKDLVKEGLYDPENFEEDDSDDEDDYYYEDDE